MVVPPSASAGSLASAPARPSPSAGPMPTVQKPKPTPPSAPGTLNGPPSGNNHAIPLSARRAEPLDISTVLRRGQPDMPEEKPDKERLFGIPNAPIYYPTEEEFRDPMEYMRKIAPEGRKYGLVKIIPPDGWNPPFAINTERFHFRTRRQELNSVEGGNRVNTDYLDQLAKFHKQNGHNLNRFPSVDKRPLDLYRLKKTVERKGGFEQVCKGKRWAEVGRDLGYSGKIMSSLSTSLKNSYQKWLLPYEGYLRVHKPGVQQQLEMMNGGPYTPSPGPSPAKKHSTPVNGVKEETSTIRASAALNASLNGHGTPPHAPLLSSPAPQDAPQSSQPPQPLPPPTSGGFTPVNAGGFTAVNATTSSASFTSVNGFTPSNSTTSQPSFESQSKTGGPQPIAPHPDGVAALKRQHNEAILTPEEIDVLQRRSKRLRKDVPTVVGSNMHHSRMSAGRSQPPRDRPNLKSGEACENCARSEDAFKMVLCVSCGSKYHMYCLEPPLKEKTDHEFNCPRCLVGTNDYGFEEGDVYSLSGFQRRADEFKTQHFSDLPKQHSPFTETKHHLTEEDVEKEFWRLVEDLSDSTEVEYGADIHSTTHGSGFPTIEKNPRDPYSTDPWNLNILPLDKESLFRHIKSDISGMTVPWLYVGMIFSTFCWHNEDHYTYSANYQHFGETKTWYGIPGEDADKFEAAMRQEVPELFETQPDLLFQLVTLAKPEKLRKAGVRVYAVDQHAGQFVITYPRAYHAGFNHGFNFNEAVNFAPHDWEPFGEEGVKRLREYRRPACFSHDELLLTAAARDHTIKTAKWLAPALERMRDDEIAARKHFLEKPVSDLSSNEGLYLGPRYESEPKLIDAQAEEEEAICTVCRCYCYLSRYLCKKTNKILCLSHAGDYECCDALDFDRYRGDREEHVLYYRMPDDALNALVRKVVDKANTPETWAAKVDNELEENPRPSLKHLRTLLSEGERIQYDDMPQLPDLRRFVDRCNEWVEEATNYITRKQQNRRKNEKVWRKGSAKAVELEERDKALRNVENIRKLLVDADQIGFDCPEIDTLQERADSIAAFQHDANVALNGVRSHTTAFFEELVERGKEFHVDIPEIDNLEGVVKRLRWNDMAKVKRPDPETKRQDQTLKDIEDFIAEGVEIGVPADNQDMLYFRDHKAQAELWEQKANELMSVEQVHYQQLDSLSHQATTLPVSAETKAAVDAILRKQRELQDKIQALVEASKNADFRKRPMYKEMRVVIEALEELQSKPTGTIELEKLQKVHEDWMRRGKKLFGKSNAPLPILLQHMQIVMNRNEYCFDLKDQPRTQPVEPSSREHTPAGDEMPMTDGSNSSRDVFCICRKVEAGMMIECELCHEWYHGKCLKIARGKVKEDDKYTCPICDWRVKIPRDAARPKLEDLQAWQSELETLPFQPEEEHVLNTLCDQGAAFREFMKPLINPENQTTPEEVGTLRFYLRKIEGADILLAEETNYLRQELHKWVPVAPEPPPPIDVSMSTRKPRPTKQQKLMAQLGITNPDDLPQHYKIKPHVAKRKASEAFGKNQPPLQPASGSSASPTGSLPPSLPTTSSSCGLGAAEKKFLTPLAIQQLGKLADAPVVSEMLKVEPHMNSEKLLKMKQVLEADPSARETSVEEMKRRIVSTTLPQPAYAYDSINRSVSGASTSPYPAATAPTAPTPYPMLSSATATKSSTPVVAEGMHLDSPATFSPVPHHSPPAPPFDRHMFDSAGGSALFDSSSVEPKPNVTSPDFGARGSGIFDSPKPGGVFGPPPGLNSPGFGGSQQSGGHVDNVFADLLHDHDGLVGFDGAHDGKSKPPAIVGDGGIASATDAIAEKGEDVMQMDGSIVQQNTAAPQLQAEQDSIVMEDFVHD